MITLLVLLAMVVVEAKMFPKAQEDELLAKHNAYRSTLLDSKYPAANMIKLEWSEKVAKSADKWAKKLAAENNCEMIHPENGEYGQNLAWQSGYSYDSKSDELSGMIDVAMDGWGKKEQDKLIPMVEAEGKTGRKFAYGLSTYDHYTQLVWANTRQLGCAYATCGADRLTVCEYDPPGNMRMNGELQEWYLKGAPCSACPDKYSCDATGQFCVPQGKGSRKTSKSSKGSKAVKVVAATPSLRRIPKPPVVVKTQPEEKPQKKNTQQLQETKPAVQEQPEEKKLAPPSHQAC